jgi:outer membrane protein insertion porin family
LDASPEIVQQAGPSLKHSLQWEYRNNSTNHRFNPTQGSNLRLKAELATPPGDVGFWKAQGGWATHFPIIFNNDLLCCHASFSTGLLRPLLFGGMCNPPNVSDRFFCGGPLQLRGFLPSGIGPRSNQFPNGDGATAKTSSLTPNGDSLGGDFFYMATLATSVGLGGLQQHSSFLRDYVRCFAFVNVGTLTGLQNTVSWNTLLHSSRVAVGAGCSVATPAGRLELTYAVPLRYSPRDARRSIQFGLGFSFD